MNTKIYVDNLATATTEHELMNLFSVYGNVADVNIAVDRANHKPRGFGFVTMVTPEGARACGHGRWSRCSGVRHLPSWPAGHAFPGVLAIGKVSPTQPPE